MDEQVSRHVQLSGLPEGHQDLSFRAARLLRARRRTDTLGGWVAPEHLTEEHHAGEEFDPNPEVSPGALEGVRGLLFQRFDALLDQVVDLSSKVSRLSAEMEGLKSRVSDLAEVVTERPVVRTTFLIQLASSKYELSRSIPIVLEQYEEESIARWPEVEATGAGCSEPEALDMLRRDIVALFEDLNTTPRSQLGGQAATALSILKAVIKNKRG